MHNSFWHLRVLLECIGTVLTRSTPDILQTWQPGRLSSQGYSLECTDVLWSMCSLTSDPDAHFWLWTMVRVLTIFAGIFERNDHRPMSILAAGVYMTAPIVCVWCPNYPNYHMTIMADVKSGADADISPGTTWYRSTYFYKGRNLFLMEQWGLLTRYTPARWCFLALFNCFAVEAERKPALCLELHCSLNMMSSGKFQLSYKKSPIQYSGNQCVCSSLMTEISS